MKLIAESRQPSYSPYLHLGYLAATSIKPEGRLFFGGILLLVTGLLFAARIVTRRFAAPYAQTAFGLRKTLLGRIGLVVLLAGFAAIAMSYTFGETTYPHGRHATRSYMQMVMADIERYVARDTHGDNRVRALPTEEGEYDLASAVAWGQHYSYMCRDGWDNPMKLRVVKRDGKMKYVLLSAGKDRQHGTADDVTSEDSGIGE